MMMLVVMLLLTEDQLFWGDAPPRKGVREPPEKVSESRAWGGARSREGGARSREEGARGRGLLVFFCVTFRRKHVVRAPPSAPRPRRITDNFLTVV